MKPKKHKKNSSNVREFPSARRFTPEEKAYLIMLFVEHENSIELVKEQFERVVKRKISLDSLIQIRAEKSEIIERRLKEIYESGVERIPCATVQNRLKKLNWIYRQAQKEKLRYTIKKGRQRVVEGEDSYMEDVFESFIGPDLKVCLQAVLGMETVMMNSRKLSLLYAKATVGGQAGDDEQDDEDIDDFEDTDKETAV